MLEGVTHAENLADRPGKGQADHDGRNQGTAGEAEDEDQPADRAAERGRERGPDLLDRLERRPVAERGGSRDENRRGDRLAKDDGDKKSLFDLRRLLRRKRIETGLALNTTSMA